LAPVATAVPAAVLRQLRKPVVAAEQVGILEQAVPEPPALQTMVQTVPVVVVVVVVAAVLLILLVVVAALDYWARAPME
jgi:hypothetical protein